MKKTLFRTILLIILLAALAASAYCIWYIYQYYHGSSYKDELRELGVIGTLTIDPEQESIEIPIDFEALQKVNPDIYGWIEIPDTGISYAMLRREGDNNYYMNHAENGSYYSGGCVFSDDFNSKDMSDTVTILYGHNLRNGTMFAKLVGYKRQAFYDEHKIFQFMTPDQNFQLDVVAAYVANTKMDAWKLGFPEDADAESWIGNALKRSVIQTGYTYTPGDRFITLSTCTYEFDNARFVVIGVIRNQ